MNELQTTCICVMVCIGLICFALVRGCQISYEPDRLAVLSGDTNIIHTLSRNLGKGFRP